MPVSADKASSFSALPAATATTITSVKSCSMTCRVFVQTSPSAAVSGRTKPMRPFSLSFLWASSMNDAPIPAFRLV